MLENAVVLLDIISLVLAHSFLFLNKSAYTAICPCSHSKGQAQQTTYLTRARLHSFSIDFSLLDNRFNFFKTVVLNSPNSVNLYLKGAVDCWLIII